MDYTNGTTFTISNVPCTIIGKYADGRIIVQTTTGLTISPMPADLDKLVDTKSK